MKNNILPKEELIISKDLDIKSMIYTIRGQQVMLDSDLAMIYGYSVKRLNEQVQRNINKFPSDFMFQLSENDISLVRCQNGTSRKDTLFKGQDGGRRYLPYAFTEQGIYMLATVLKGDLATAQTIYIIRSFKQLRHMYIDNNVLLDRIVNNEVKLLEYKTESDDKFNMIFDYIGDHKEVTQKIFYKGQIYEAFSFLSDLIAKANKEIILIDNYVDIKTLNILAKKKMNVICKIYTSYQGNKLTDIDVNTFNNNHLSLTVYNTSKFHDRFLILDKKEVYLIGASLKDAGKKTFGIIEIDKSNINNLFTALQ